MENKDRWQTISLYSEVRANPPQCPYTFMASKPLLLTVQHPIPSWLLIWKGGLIPRKAPAPSQGWSLNLNRDPKSIPWFGQVQLSHISVFIGPNETHASIPMWKKEGYKGLPVVSKLVNTTDVHYMTFIFGLKFHLFDAFRTQEYSRYQ